jgi:threonine/homoserine/homoserine lactone efflux protein
MELPLLLKGAVVGFCLAVPIGPINVLCMRRTLAYGRFSGMASGAGAAMADAIYGGVAAFGLHFISQALVGHQMWFRLLGGALLCYLGYRTFTAQPQGKELNSAPRGLLADGFSTFFLTLTNPLTIVSFAALFAAMDLGRSQAGLLGPALLVAGVFMGSMAWWIFLAGLVGLFRDRLGTQGLRWANRTSGAVIAGFGLVSMLSFKL